VGEFFEDLQSPVCQQTFHKNVISAMSVFVKTATLQESWDQRIDESNKESPLVKELCAGEGV
jgi:hypothetical protein